MTRPSPGATMTPGDNQIVDVDLGERSYKIHIGTGLISAAGGLVAPLLQRPRTIIVTDDNVGAVCIRRKKGK